MFWDSHMIKTPPLFLKAHCRCCCVSVACDACVLFGAAALSFDKKGWGESMAAPHGEVLAQQQYAASAEDTPACRLDGSPGAGAGDRQIV